LGLGQPLLGKRSFTAWACLTKKPSP